VMIYRVHKDEWKKMSYNAHLTCFGEFRDPELDRIDYALLVVDDEAPLAYCTVREVDKATAYMQYGGAFPSLAKYKVLSAYLLMMKHLAGNYIRGTTLIENTNLGMLKMAMKAGWLIKGLRVFDQSILLEHQINFEKVA